MFGIPIKYLSLLILVVQNSALILLMRYTRSNVEENKLYLASTAVVMSELLKCFVCLVLVYLKPISNKRSIKRLISILDRELVLKWRETLKLAIPSTLYLIQNNLQYVAATNLDAATFQVTYQLKILTTAFFSVIILNKSLSRLKWISLAILTVGIGLVVLPKGASTMIIAYLTGNIITESDIPIGNQSNLKGFIAVLSACLLSGLAGVYFEKILKEGPVKPSLIVVDEESKKTLDLEEEEEEAGGNQIWIRNIQMSLFSILFGMVFVVLLQDGATVTERGFFVNYTPLTVVVISIQALGGLIVALVVKYADNILKGFATSISIILSSIISIWFFNFSLSVPFSLGAILVIYSTYLYSL